jgi:predicted branched-subunit amino acid permease
MTAAIAYALAKYLLRKIILGYAILNALIYVVITIIGVVQPSKFLLSFEVLMLFALPGILLVITLSGIRYLKNQSPLDASLFLAGLLMILVQAAYFMYYAAGITQALYQEGTGFYFSENDVLYVGMILWLWYVVKAISKNLRDINT